MLLPTRRSVFVLRWCWHFFLRNSNLKKKIRGRELFSRQKPERSERDNKKNPQNNAGCIIIPKGKNESFKWRVEKVIISSADILAHDRRHVTIRHRCVHYGTKIADRSIQLLLEKSQIFFGFYVPQSKSREKGITQPVKNRANTKTGNPGNCGRTIYKQW
jgi:hypothetical protein